MITHVKFETINNVHTLIIFVRRQKTIFVRRLIVKERVTAYSKFNSISSKSMNARLNVAGQFFEKCRKGGLIS